MFSPVVRRALTIEVPIFFFWSRDVLRKRTPSAGEKATTKIATELTQISRVCVLLLLVTDSSYIQYVDKDRISDLNISIPARSRRSSHNVLVMTMMTRKMIPFLRLRIVLIVSLRRRWATSMSYASLLPAAFADSQHRRTLHITASMGRNNDLTPHTPEGYCRYFAIGSMMNPMSFRGRGLAPIDEGRYSSVPAKLLNYKIGFFGRLGFAEAVYEEGASMHGVIHYMKPEDMDRLDTIEASYDRAFGTAEVYDRDVGSRMDSSCLQQVNVTLYIKSAAKAGATVGLYEALPQARYVDCLVEGAMHYGVNEEYIDYLENGVGRQPRPDPASYRSFGEVPPYAPTISWEQLLANDGQDGRPLYLAFGNKVLEYQEHLWDQGRDKILNMPVDPAKDATIRICGGPNGMIGDVALARLQYDPKHGMPESANDVSSEYMALLEHNYYLIMQTMGESHLRWKVIASFARPCEGE
jgi:hypothetical protein